MGVNLSAGQHSGPIHRHRHRLTLHFRVELIKTVFYKSSISCYLFCSYFKYPIDACSIRTCQSITKFVICSIFLSTLRHTLVFHFQSLYLHFSIFCLSVFIFIFPSLFSLSFSFSYASNHSVAFRLIS